MTTYRQTSDPSSGLRLLEKPKEFLKQSVEAVYRFPDSLPLHVFRVAQRVRWGDIEYTEAWETMCRAGVESGAAEAWVRREVYHGFANAAAFKEEPPHLTALEGGAV